MTARSWDEIFPRWFSNVNQRCGTPHWSLLALFICASALMFWSGGLEEALSIATFSYLVAAGVGAIALLSQAANWGTLFSGRLDELTTLAIYRPWLAIGLVVFAIYSRLGKSRGTDVNAILDTWPGVEGETISSLTARK